MKRTNLRVSVALVLLLAIILPVLAACGGPSGGTQPTAAPTAAGEQPTSAPPATAETQPTADTSTEPTAETGGDTGNAKPGILRLAIGAEPENLDPQQASFVGEIQWIMLNYLPLMTFDSEGKPIPGAAESYEVSADGKTYTFKIRPDSKYSDGSPLTAQNFEFAWKRLADPLLAGQYQSIACGIIKGYSELASTTCPDAEGNTKTVTDVESMDLEPLREALGVKAVDDSTLQIELTNPAPFFLSMAALWIGAPVREQDAENLQDLATGVPENYIGNGPFKLVTHDPDVRAVWEANENWPLGPLKLKGIEMSVIKESQVAFQAYKNGELDMIGLAAEDLGAVESDAELSKQVIDLPGQCTFYLGFNQIKAPFDKKQVRQAFAQAFDREAWVRDVLHGLGKPTQTFIPPGFPGYEPSDMWAFDPEAAKKTLADAGFANGEGLPEIKLTFASSARNKVRFEWIANQIKQNLGIDVKLDPVDPTAYTALLKDKETTPQMFFLGWCADYPDPQNWLSTVFKTGGITAQRITWSNKQFDDLTAKADIEPDAATRAKLYSEAQNILIEDAPVVFISNDANKELIKPYVKGVKVTPLDYIPGFFNLTEVSVEP